MNFALRANRPAEVGCDPVILEIDMRAARRADSRTRGPADLLFRLALETFDDRITLPRPKTFELAKKRRVIYRDRFRLREELWLGFRLGRGRSVAAAALAAHRAFGCDVLQLLEAALRTIHTDFRRRRLSHGSRMAKATPLSAGPESGFHGRGRFFIADDLRPRGRGRADLATGDFRFADECGAFLNHETGRLQITLQNAA